MDAWYLPVLLAVLGAALGGGSAARLARLRRLRSSGTRALGVIVGQRHGSAPTAGAVGSADVKAPVVRFTTTGGQLIETAPALTMSNSSYVPGRPVVVHYDPARPDVAAIVGYETGGYRLLLVLGALLLVLAATIGILPRDAWTPVFGVLPGLIPLALGLVFGIIGGYGVSRVGRLHRSGVAATGTVVGETTSSSDNGLTLHHPVVRYSLPTGQTVDVPSFRGTVTVRAAPGQQVNVRYDPADPGRMLLQGDGPEPLFVIFMLVGVLVFVIGVAVAFHLLTS